jgi:alpha-galactosidase
MDKKIVLVGAGSTSFGPSTLIDLFHSKVLTGSTIVLHDINKDLLEIIYRLIYAENEIQNYKFKIERTIERNKAFKDADFIISSIEVGDRFKLWREDYEIPRKYGSTQILGECGGPGGTMHAFRIIPPVIDIAKDAEKICPNAFLINFSNPLARVCLAIKRVTNNLKFIGLCHQIGFLNKHLPRILNKPLEQLKIKVGGLNHFAFLLSLEERKTRKNLMPDFNSKAFNYFKQNEDRFEFSTLTFEMYRRFGYFPYVGDNHLGEYLQFGEEFTKRLDMIDWINRTEYHGKLIFEYFMWRFKKFKKGRFPRKGILPKISSEERAIPIIEEIIQNKDAYEVAVNIPNEQIIDNLPQDLILECSAIVNKDGVHGIKIGKIPKQIAAILNIEATIQDLCVEAILKSSKELAITCLAIDPNVGNFEIAEKIFNEMKTKNNYYNYFK